MMFLIMYFDEGLSKLRSGSDNRGSHDLPIGILSIRSETSKFNVRKGMGEIRYERMILCFLSITSSLCIGFKPNRKL